jgi:hypothetical protein
MSDLHEQIGQLAASVSELCATLDGRAIGHAAGQAVGQTVAAFDGHAVGQAAARTLAYALGQLGTHGQN